MDKKNTIACSCSNRIDVSDKDLFSKVKCSKCKTEYPVCGFIGNFIFEEKLAENNIYSTYKGFQESSIDEKLAIKLISADAKFTSKNLEDINKALNKLPENLRLSSHEVEERFIFTREFYETSLKDYLDSSRPRSNKAIAILQESADILNVCTEKGAIPVSLSIGNLLMDGNGKIILSDLTFRETLAETISCRKDLITKEWSQAHYLADGKATLAASVYSYGRLAKFLCCGSLAGEVKLDLRDGEPSKLKELINKILNEPKSFNSFKDINIKLTEILNPSLADAKAPIEKKSKAAKPEKGKAVTKKAVTKKVNAKKAVSLKDNVKIDALNKINAKKAAAKKGNPKTDAVKLDALNKINGKTDAVKPDSAKSDAVKPEVVKKDNVKKAVNFANTNKSPSPKARKRRQKSNNTPIIIGAALCLVVGVIIVIATSNSGGERQSQQVAKKTTKPETAKKTPAKKPIKKIEPKKVLVLPGSTVATKSQPVLIKPETAVEGQANPFTKREIAKPTESKEEIKERLIPKDFNFDSLNSDIDLYLAASENRTLENDRIDIVSTYRDHLLSHFKKRPYSGLFHLNDFPLFRAKIKSVDPEKIMLRDMKTGKEFNINWDQLKIEQFNEFASYYAAVASEEFSIAENNDQIFKKVADEYKRLAIFLHWYGQSESAIRYKQKACKIDNTLNSYLDKMITDVVN